MSAPAILVTGAAKRLGAAIARRFAADGWHVVIHYNASANAAREFAAELPNAEAVAFDLADPAAVDLATADLAARLPAWRALVLNASRFEPDWPVQLDWSVLDMALAANFTGNARLAARFLALTDPANARRIVTVLDQKLANLNPDFASYTASKAALAAWTRMLAMEPPAPGDRVFGLAPGLSQPSHDQTGEEFARSSTLNLLHRRTRLDEIAEAAHFLVTGPLGSGTVLHVDSGQHLVRQPRDVMYAVRAGETHGGAPA